MDTKMDQQLSHVYNVLNVPEETQIALSLKHKIVSIEDLSAKRVCLGGGRFRTIDRIHQEQLAAFVAWADDYTVNNGRSPEICRDFHSESFSSFRSMNHSGGIEVSDELKHIYSELDLSEKTMHRLFDAGIQSFGDLLLNRHQLEDQSLPGIHRRTQEDLNAVIRWADFFKKRYKRVPCVLSDFDEDAFMAFREREQSGPESCYAVAKTCLHQEGGTESMTLLPEEALNAIYRFGASRVAKEYLSVSLKRKKWCFPFLKTFVGAVLNLPLKVTCEKPFVLAGKTQAGKTAVKAVLQAICFELRCPLIIVTKGVSESRELHAKLQDYARESRRDDIAQMTLSGSPGKGIRWKSRESEVRTNLMGGGSLVVADTKSQIKRAIQSVEWIRQNEMHHKFVLIVDEADAMYRTEDRSQQFEMEYDRLLSLKPSVTVFITATPVPVLLVLKEEEKQDAKLLSIEPETDYFGSDDMEVLRNSNGEEVFLETDGVELKNGFSFDESSLSEATSQYRLSSEDNGETPSSHACVGFMRPSSGIIPFTDRKIMDLYQQSLSNSLSKGVLVLDITNPRVWADRNVFQKATCIQDLFYSRAKSIAVIVFVGRGIYFRLPGYKNGMLCAKNTRISEVINMIDHKYPDLSMPIFIFGYSKMDRGMSFRSAHRVPTHIVMFKGIAYSIESVVQTLGRATFNGKSILHGNGHSHVTVLTTAPDWDTIKMYPQFVLEVQKRVEHGESLEDAFSGAKSKLPASVNYRQHTHRKTGQMKRGVLCKYLDKVEFEEHGDLDASDGLKHTKTILWEEVQTQRILRVLLEIQTKDGIDYHPIKDIEEGYNDTYQGDIGSHARITKTALRKELGNLHKKAIVEKKRYTEDGKKNDWLWSGKEDIIEFVLNDELAYMDHDGDFVPDSNGDSDSE